MSNEFQVVMVPVSTLRHIEGHSAKRVNWLVKKIQLENCWTKPLALDDTHHLVLDGQHRMEAAKLLQLSYVPAIKFNYANVEVWSLRTKYDLDWRQVQERSLAGNIYPYKTVKHRFPIELPTLFYPLSELKA